MQSLDTNSATIFNLIVLNNIFSERQTYVNVTILNRILESNVLKIRSAGETVRLLVHGLTGPINSITGQTVLSYKYKIKYTLTKYIKFSE